MNLDEGYYIVARCDGKKSELLRVNKVEGKQIYTTLERTRHLDPEYITVSKRDVLAVLGKSPTYGKVHNVTVETWKRAVEHDVFGELNIFHELEEQHFGRLLRGFDKVGKLLRKNGVHKFLPCNVEIRHPVGKVAGSYRFTGKDPQEKPDTLTVRPDEKHDDFAYVIAHEAGHGVWFRLFRSKKGRARWIQAYHSYITINKLDEEQLTDFVERAFASGSPSASKGNLSAEELGLFKVIAEHVKRVHALSLDDLDILAETGASLMEYMPSVAEISEKQYHITEYAMKSVKEFFAECFALWILEKKLPPKITSLMEKTIHAAANVAA